MLPYFILSREKEQDIEYLPALISASTSLRMCFDLKTLVLISLIQAFKFEYMVLLVSTEVPLNNK